MCKCRVFGPLQRPPSACWVQQPFSAFGEDLWRIRAPLPWISTKKDRRLAILLSGRGSGRLRLKTCRQDVARGVARHADDKKGNGHGCLLAVGGRERPAHLHPDVWWCIAGIRAAPHGVTMQEKVAFPPGLGIIQHSHGQPCV